MKLPAFYHSLWRSQVRAFSSYFCHERQDENIIEEKTRTRRGHSRPFNSKRSRRIVFGRRSRKARGLCRGKIRHGKFFRRKAREISPAAIRAVIDHYDSRACGSDPKSDFPLPAFTQQIHGMSSLITPYVPKCEALLFSPECVKTVTFMNQAGLTAETDDWVSAIRAGVQNLVSMQGLSVDVEDLIVQITSVVSVVVGLSYSTTLGTAIPILQLFCSGLKINVFEALFEYFRDMFFSNQAGGDKNAAMSPEWLLALRQCRTDWKLFKESNFFSEVSRFLGLLVVLKLSDAANLTFSVKDYKIFEPDMKLVHGDALDIIDAGFSTVAYFVENIYESYQEGSFRPFFISDKTARDLDEEYGEMVKFHDLWKSGNLLDVEGVHDEDYYSRLQEFGKKIRAIAHSKRGFEKKLLLDRLEMIVGFVVDYDLTANNCVGREAPFTIEFFGKSGVGKTTIKDQVVNILLASMGYSLDPKFQATYNPNDPFMSNMKSDTIVITLDDFVNGKANFQKTSPTDIIIQLCNNTPFCANMADLSQKGKVYLQPKIVPITTNKKDLGAYEYSVNPTSIQRRAHYIITVEVKKEFRKNGLEAVDTTKVTEHYKRLGTYPVVQDVWRLKVEEVGQARAENELAPYKVVYDDYYGYMEDIDSQQLVNFLARKMKEHDANQKDIMERAKRKRDITFCGHEGCRMPQGVCHQHPMSQWGDFHKQTDDTIEKPEEPTQSRWNLLGFRNQSSEAPFGSRIAKGFRDSLGICLNRVYGDLSGFDHAIEGATTCVTIMAANEFAKRWDWMKVIPSDWVENDYFQKAMMFMDRDKIKRAYVTRTTVNVGLLFSSMMVSWCRYKPIWRTIAFFTPFLVTSILYQCMLVDVVKRRYRRDLMDRNNLVYSLKRYRDTTGKTVIKALGVIGVLYTLSKVYRHWFTISDNLNQGKLEPNDSSDIEERASEKSRWVKPERHSLPMSEKSKCTSPLAMANIATKNLLGVQKRENNKVGYVNGLMIRSNVIILPNHFIQGAQARLEMHKGNPNAHGYAFKSLVSKSKSVKVPDTDLRMFYLPSGGSYKDITPWLPDANLPEHEFTLMWRNSDGEVTFATGRAEPRVTSNQECSFVGGIYASLDTPTFDGLCGALLVSHCRGSCISGYHLGGKENTTQGCYTHVKRSTILECVEQLRKIDGVVLTGSAENFDNQSYDKPIDFSKELHRKSCLNFMPDKSQICYHASMGAKSSSNSTFKVTPISSSVESICGVANKWMAPKMRPEWWAWQKAISNMSESALCFDDDLLSAAVLDYKRDLYPIYQLEYIRKQVRVLTDFEVLNGIVGVQFIDSMDLNTVMGLPLTGPKRDYVIELPPTVERPCNRVFQPLIMEEIRRCESKYADGERAFMLIKGCKKDEIVDKEKCRVFFSNPVALTFLIRKYFLPLTRILQLFPLKSECAVGINPEGPEWHEFHSHITKHGADRLIGGDYSKYDQKISSQLLLSAFSILIDFAKLSGYTDRDIRIMESLAGDVVFAYVVFNGDLFSITTGTHVSGNSLTVILNSIVGSLNMRCAFYGKFDRSIPFRSVVALMTYGDDNIGSVDRKFDFTITHISKFLGQYGQIYTMPDKTSEILDFLPATELEFLKRKNYFCPKRNCKTGALSEDSIFKSLHCFLRPKSVIDSERLACAKNIDNAIRDWFHHGEDVFERRIQDMRRVAEVNNLNSLCKMLNVSYDDLIVEWKLRYRTL